MPGRSSSPLPRPASSLHQHESSATAPRGDGLPVGMPATRKLSAEELSLVVLSLLAEQESYGSQLGERIERLSGGFYRPSPGVLYPVLATLSRAGHIDQTREGRRKYYHLTPAGRAYLLDQDEAARRVGTRLDFAGRKLRALYDSMSQSVDDATLALPLAQEMLGARMDLKAALHESRHLPIDRQRRIIQLLQDTAARIRAEATLTI